MKCSRKDRNHFEKQICIQQQFGHSKPELVYSSTAFLEDVISLVSELHSKLQYEEENLSAPENKDGYSPILELFQAAQVLYCELEACEGLDINPVDNSAFYLEKSMD